MINHILLKIMSSLPLFNKGFPKYTKEIIDKVNVYWYEAEFSQSRYPPGQEISEACTLICLLVAQRISHLDLQVLDIDNNSQFNAAMAEAIIEGNSVHAYLVKNKLISNPYMDAEEALQFGGKKLSQLKEWKFLFFNQHLDSNLFKNIRSFLCEWYKYPKSQNLFMLLITCGRTILFTFQQQTRMVTLFDPHGHSNDRFLNRGLVVAQSPIENLEDLCKWYVRDVMHNCYQVVADQYELSCLYYQQPQRSCSYCECKCSASNKNLNY